MFKEGQVYKVKLELSPDLIGFGRATVVAVEPNRIYVQLRSSKGNKLNLPVGAKIWFVTGTAANRFNGLWTSEIKGNRILNGINVFECRTPKFEQTQQKRSQARSEISAPMEILGDEWRNYRLKAMTRNISRLGLGFSLPNQCHQEFSIDSQIMLTIYIGSIPLHAKIRVVNSRFNWLLNRTEVGAEFIDMDLESTKNLERILTWLGNKAIPETRAELTDSGSLARWVKAGKDQTRFVKGEQKESASDSKAAEQAEKQASESKAKYISVNIDDLIEQKPEDSSIEKTGETGLNTQTEESEE
ncbi:MAG: PilZ domain-containing protein [Candidatus Obscuribacterales bacterium]|nr:PilZ domain-containing protein [Candidatus Obscuribacterales bacterium]